MLLLETFQNTNLNYYYLRHTQQQHKFSSSFCFPNKKKKFFSLELPDQHLIVQSQQQKRHIFLKLAIKTPEGGQGRHSGVFIVNFE